MSFSRLVPRFGRSSLFGEKNALPFVSRVQLRGTTTRFLTSDEGEREREEEREFLPLQIKPKPPDRWKSRELVDTTGPPRATKMDPDQDWTNVWPTSGVFRHSVTPLPVRMGVIVPGSDGNYVPPEKWKNVELLKISNFLHLTPKHVEKHCEALQQFCTPWPEGLETEEDFDQHFPVEVTTRDFVYSWSLRDERSKINDVKVKLSALHLDYHARDKIVRLAEGRLDVAPDPEEEELKKTQIGVAGDTPKNLIIAARKAKWNITTLNEQRMMPDGVLRWRRRRRYGWWDKKKHWLHPEVHALQEELPEKPTIADYDYQTDTLSLHTEQCPTRKQNYDHAIYLLKALYGEAWKTEPWESDKEFADLERFVWEKSESKDVALRLYRAAYPDRAEEDEEAILGTPEVREYRDAIETLLNYGETTESLERYKTAVKKLFAMAK